MYVTSLFCDVLFLEVFEWRTDEDSITLIMLALTIFGMGALQPSCFWLSAVLLGRVVTVLNLVTRVTGLRPVYETVGRAHAHGVAYGASLLILVVPALAAAGIGAIVRRAVRSESTAA